MAIDGLHNAQPPQATGQPKGLSFGACAAARPPHRELPSTDHHLQHAAVQLLGEGKHLSDQKTNEKMAPNLS